MDEVILNERYVAIEFIRKTSSAQVILCKDLKSQPHNSHPYVAVKVMRRDLAMQGSQEFNMMQSLANKGGKSHLVTPLELFNHDGHTCIAMELLGHCLHDVCRSIIFPSSSVRKISRKLFEDLQFLHSLGVLHADIKPGNIAFDLPRSTIKLLDFGNAMSLSEVHLYHDHFEVQTLRYRAPEVLFGCEFGSAIDTWSLGISLLEICAGHPVFKSETARGLVHEWVAFFGPDFDVTPFRKGKLFSQRYDLSCEPDRELNIDPYQQHHQQRIPLSNRAEEDQEKLGSRNKGDRCRTGEMEQDEESKREDYVTRYDKASQDNIFTRKSIAAFLHPTNPELARDQAAIDFFCRLLCPSPTERMSVEGAIEHRFVAA